MGTVRQRSCGVISFSLSCKMKLRFLLAVDVRTFQRISYITDRSVTKHIGRSFFFLFSSWIIHSFAIAIGNKYYYGYGCIFVIPKNHLCKSFFYSVKAAAFILSNNRGRWGSLPPTPSVLLLLDTDYSLSINNIASLCKEPWIFQTLLHVTESTSVSFIVLYKISKKVLNLRKF